MKHRHWGVLSEAGDVPEAALWRNAGRYTLPPETRPETAVKLHGTYLWGGLLLGHFGHFLVETTSRLWALDREAVDGVVFIPRKGGQYISDAYQHEVLELFGVDVPVHVLDEPSLVERLAVPGQGFGLGEIGAGTPEFRAAARAMSKGVPPHGPARIYVSRSRFPRGGSVMDEPLLEANLERQGYVTVHPQDFSLREQIAMYNAAERVVATEGSALHLLGFAGREDLQVAVIPRRTHPDLENILTQLNAFLPRPPDVIDALVAQWMVESQTSSNNNSWGELDFARLGRELHARGYITDLLAWQVPSPSPTPQAVTFLSERQKKKLVRRERKELMPTSNGTPGSIENMEVVGICRFSMLGRGDWKAYRGQPDEKLEEIYAQKATELFDPERMEHRLATFEHLTLRSLAAQTDDRFRFLVVSSDRMPEHYQARLRALCEGIEQVTLRFVEPKHITYVQKEVFEEVGLYLPDCVQFRLDDDDCVSRDFIRRARRNAQLLWKQQAFAMSFAKQYYCVTDGPTEGIYNWFSPFLGTGAFVRHKTKSIFEFSHYRIQNKLLSMVDPSVPNIITHAGNNDTPRHEAQTLKKRGMTPASEADITRAAERHFDYLTDEGLRLTTFDRFVRR